MPEEAPFGDLFDVAPSGMLILAPDGEIRRANPAFCELLGWESAQLVGRSVCDVNYEGDVASMQASLLTIGDGVLKMGTRFRRSDEKIIHASVVGRMLFDHRGEPFRILLIIADLSDRKRAEQAESNVAAVSTQRQLLETQLRDREERLRVAQKMEALGQLAGGIAHDFNNLLTVITSCVTLAVEETSQDDPRAEDLNEIRRAAESAAGLIRRLLMVARKDTSAPQVIDLGEVVARSGRMLKRMLGGTIEVETTTPRDEVLVEIDTVQLDQLLLNLAMNARDAMPDGGQLRLSLERGSAHAILRVTDSGCGMDEATVARIFEPFFTTKGPDHGTGLGLATCYQLVRDAKGRLEVASVVGLGTTFTVTLPLAEVTSVRDTIPHAMRLPRQSLRILLVEDDLGVRSITQRMLEREGHKVTTASDGEEGLQLLRAPREFDIVLSDVRMPKLTGIEMLRELRSQGVRMPVLLMTGYQQAFDWEGLNVPVIAKPFTPESLNEAIQDTMMDGPR